MEEIQTTERRKEANRRLLIQTGNKLHEHRLFLNPKLGQDE